jgi:Family of unknown function (DUF6252)
MKRCLLLLVILLIGCCKKFSKAEVEDLLPEATMEGKNTFGCMLNEDLFLPKNYSQGFSLIGGQNLLGMGYDGSQVFIYATKFSKNRDKQTIYLYSNKVREEGNYTLKFLDENSGTSYLSRLQDQTNGTFYPISDTNQSTLHISKLDTTSRILSGTFSFNVNINTNSVVHVHQGVFDLKY